MKQYDKKKDFCIVIACEERQEIYGFTQEYNFKTYDNKFDQSNNWLYEKTIKGIK